MLASTSDHQMFSNVLVHTPKLRQRLIETVQTKATV